MNNRYKIALYAKGKVFYYNENYNFFNEEGGTIYINKTKAEAKLKYARDYGTTMNGELRVIKLEKKTLDNGGKTSMLKLKKGNYLAVIPFVENKKMVEVEALNEEDAFRVACEYATAYCESHNYQYVEPVIMQIPDCITVLEVSYKVTEK